MERIVIADKDLHSREIRLLFLEYLVWAASRVLSDFGWNVSADEIVERDMVSLDKFMPQNGRLLIAFVDEAPVGIACLKELTGDIGEIKRMYIQPALRGRVIGKALLLKLIDEALTIGYTCLRLDSASFMTEAHNLYHSLGFSEIGPYEGSEIPKEFQHHWVFMEKQLAR